MSYEHSALKHLLSNHLEIVQDLRVDMFGRHNQKLYKMCLEYFEKTNTLPTPQLLKAEVELRAPVSQRSTFLAKIDAIMGAADIPIIQVIDSLKESITLRAVDQKIEELLDAQREKDGLKVRGIVNSIYETVSLQTLKVKEAADAFEEDDGFTLIPSGLGPELDAEIGGGYTGLCLIGAKSGGLKSVALQNAAVAAVRDEKNVLFISLELSGRVLGNRIKAQLSGIPFDRINTSITTEAEQKTITESMAFLKDRSFRMITDPLDADMLVNAIHVEKQLHDTDVVFIDYINLVPGGVKDSGESWASLASLAKKLHRLTMELGIVIVTPVQVTVEKQPDEANPPELTTRGSKELIFSSSQFFFLHDPGTTAPDEDDIRVLYTIKNRIARASHNLVHARPEIMTLTQTGVTLNPK